MSTRRWPYPDLRNGTTIHHLTDTHFGAQDFVNTWLEQTRLHLTRLRATNAGHVHTGDMIHNYFNTTAADDAAYVSWRTALKAAEPGKPYAEAVGNHDLGRYIDGAPVLRTTDQWEAAVGVPDKNSVTTMGAVKVITVGPDSWPWPDNSQSVLTAATLSWLDAQLTAAGSTPCWIAAHAPLREQYPAQTAGSVQQPEASLDAVLGAHDNVIGWLSGHLHSPVTDTTNVAAVTVAGKRLFTVNGPAAGGGRIASVPYAEHQFRSPNHSALVTYLGDAVDVRWLDHNRWQWANDSSGGHYRHTLLRS